MTAPLEMTGLRVATRAGRELVAEVDLVVAPGERVGLIGASGSGKTVLASAAAGLLPDELRATGRVTLAGTELLGAPERVLARLRGRRVGMVFQEPLTALDPTMRVGRQVAGAVRRDRLGRTARTARVHELLADTGLADPGRIGAAFPHQLSGGQRQRVVLAMALAGRPDLLICDEPTTALDVTVQARVLDLIDARVRDAGAALLFISHDLAVVGALCDRIVVLDRGRVVEQGDTEQVLTRPRHAVTGGLLAQARAAW